MVQKKALLVFWVVISLFLIIFLTQTRSKSQEFDGWTTKIGQEIASFTLDGDAIFANDKIGGLWKFDQGTGEVTGYQYVGGDSSLAPLSFTENSLLITNSQGFLTMVNKKSMKNIWTFQVPSFTEPNLPIINDNLIIFTDRKNVIYVINGNSGSLLWSKDSNLLFDKKYSATSKGEVTLYVDDENVYLESEKHQKILTCKKITGECHSKSLLTVGNIFNATDGAKVTNTFVPEMLVNSLETPQNVEYSISKKTANQSILTKISKENQTVIWQKQIDNNCNSLLLVQKTLITSCLDGQINAISSEFGELLWATQLNGQPKKSLVFPKFPNIIFVISFNLIGNNKVTAVNTSTGNKIWQSPELSLDLGSLIISDSKIFAKSQDGRMLTQLASNQPLRTWPLAPISFTQNYLQAQKPISLQHYCPTSDDFSKQSLLQATKSNSDNLMKLTLSANDQAKTVSTSVSDVIELTLRGSELTNTSVQFWQNNNELNHVNGYQTKTDEYQFRFSPNRLGLWFWKLKNNHGENEFSGSFFVSTIKPFLTIEQENWYLGKKPFIGVGIQSSINDDNFDGDWLDNWQSSKSNIPVSKINSETDYQSAASYFESMSQSGFNVFRLSLDNANFRIANCLTDKTFIPNLQTSFAVDEILKISNKNNMKVFFGIFGFELFTHNSKITPESGIGRYLDYVMNRYSSLIDVWELANEASPSNEWIEQVSEYIKQRDPYHHPITITWQRPDHDSIDITNLHYYGSETLDDIFNRFGILILNNQKWHKPTAISEIGNSGASWDAESVGRFSHRNWLSVFLKSPIIWWDQPAPVYYHDHSANIYLGPLERKSVKILREFVDNHIVQIKKFLQIRDEFGEIAWLVIETDTQLLFYPTKSSVGSLTSMQLKSIGLIPTKNALWFDTKTGLTSAVFANAKYDLAKNSELGVFILSK